MKNEIENQIVRYFFQPERGKEEAQALRNLIIEINGRITSDVQLHTTLEKEIGLRPYTVTVFLEDDEKDIQISTDYINNYAFLTPEGIQIYHANSSYHEGIDEFNEYLVRVPLNRCTDTRLLDLFGEKQFKTPNDLRKRVSNVIDKLTKGKPHKS